MCQQTHGTLRFLHSGSRDEVVTPVQSVEVESREFTCSLCVPHESRRWLLQGLLLTGGKGVGVGGGVRPAPLTVCLVSAALCGGTASVLDPVSDPCTS